MFKFENRHQLFIIKKGLLAFETFFTSITQNADLCWNETWSYSRVKKTWATFSYHHNFDQVPLVPSLRFSSSFRLFVFFFCSFWSLSIKFYEWVWFLQCDQVQKKMPSWYFVFILIFSNSIDCWLITEPSRELSMWLVLRLDKCGLRDFDFALKLLR